MVRGLLAGAVQDEGTEQGGHHRIAVALENGGHRLDAPHLVALARPEQRALQRRQVLQRGTQAGAFLHGEADVAGPAADDPPLVLVQPHLAEVDIAVDAVDEHLAPDAAVPVPDPGGVLRQAGSGVGERVEALLQTSRDGLGGGPLVGEGHEEGIVDETQRLPQIEALGVGEDLRGDAHPGVLEGVHAGGQAANRTEDVALAVVLEVDVGHELGGEAPGDGPEHLHLHRDARPHVAVDGEHVGLTVAGPEIEVEPVVGAGVAHVGEVLGDAAHEHTGTDTVAAGEVVAQQLTGGQGSGPQEGTVVVQEILVDRVVLGIVVGKDDVMAAGDRCRGEADEVAEIGNGVTVRRQRCVLSHLTGPSVKASRTIRSGSSVKRVFAVSSVISRVRRPVRSS